MNSLSPRPRLLFFQWDHAPNKAASGFLTLQMNLHVKCLAQFFDVTVISHDCDFDQVCDRHQPDLVLFEAGYRSHGSRRIRIDNTRAHPGIPRLGLHNGDPWCDRRAGFWADMDDWGVETAFAIGTATPAYMPDQADRIFVWPNFIDPDMFRFRGQAKVIPVMLTGQSGPLYPWRSAVYQTLAQHYPSLITPAFRYEDAGARRLLAGQAYADALSASWVSPSCGTMGHELVRKHLEIPGAGCLLVTERTPVLEAAGFRDGENCVFATPSDVVEKIDALMADPERMLRITRAGHTLVAGRHTLHHRRQIRDWFDLHQTLGSGQRIVQPGPFAPLKAVAVASARHHGHLPATGLDRLALQKAHGHLAKNELARARQQFEAALAYVPYLPEAKLGLALCDLAENRPDEAFRRLSALIRVTITEYGASRPDPAEWALCLLALMASGREAEAIALRYRYPSAGHAGLARVKGVLDQVASDDDRAVVGASIGSGSIHPTTPAMTQAIDRELAAFMARRGEGSGRHPVRVGQRSLVALDRLLRIMPVGTLRPRLPPAPGFGYLIALRDALGRKLLPPSGRRLARRMALRIHGSRTRHESRP
ncbi:glycosyltransferase [Paracoccus aerius]|uniref:Glycosyltransferase n=1 Tax=Paracoccus aerius TaxID=1915382 RepID=A0ABS1S6A1_9RHOB|nr:glycosyltransferase [Paracoccus aerius]MBL3673222.1 glycosyltransferase [Paracoccus aerius]GHG17554.1 hypothetical protein GCM10017322_12900 [Paracoccus aerius]